MVFLHLVPTMGALWLLSSVRPLQLRALQGCSIQATLAGVQVRGPEYLKTHRNSHGLPAPGAHHGRTVAAVQRAAAAAEGAAGLLHPVLLAGVQVCASTRTCGARLGRQPKLNSHRRAFPRCM